jgi:hypothetical protein
LCIRSAKVSNEIGIHDAAACAVPFVNNFEKSYPNLQTLMLAERLHHPAGEAVFLASLPADSLVRNTAAGRTLQSSDETAIGRYLNYARNA